jgi:hypothetical protein
MMALLHPGEQTGWHGNPRNNTKAGLELWLAGGCGLVR